VRDFVMGNRRLPIMPVAFVDEIAAALAGPHVATKCLAPDAVLSAPANILVELAVRFGFGAARVWPLLPVAYAGRAMDWWIVGHLEHS